MLKIIFRVGLGVGFGYISLKRRERALSESFCELSTALMERVERPASPTLEIF